jgi:signal transduction histidine kinase
MSLRKRTLLVGGLVLALLLGGAYLVLHLLLDARSESLSLTPAQRNDVEFWIALTFSAVLVAFSVAGVALMDHFLLKRLFHLEQDVAGIASGSSLQIRMAGNDEIARLGRNIDQMVESLRRTTRELRRTRDIAERAEAAKTRLLASASHEMRTPLNGILGLIALLRHSPNLSAADLENLNLMGEAGNQLLLKVNTLLDHSLLETGGIALRPESFSLQKLLRQVVEEILPEAHRKGLAVHVEFDPEVPQFLLGDENRLAQVLRHLLDNAVKFTAKGEVGVHVLGTTEPALLAFKVYDTGMGIPPAEREAVFHPFEQPHASKDSMGLGLSICRMLADLMGGRIELKGQPGEGSQFTFMAHLPAADPKLAASPAPFPGIPALLFHEDDHSRRILADLLKRLGMDVQEHRNAESPFDPDPRAVVFWGLPSAMPPVPNRHLCIRKRIGFDPARAGELLEPFFPSEVLEACNASLRAPLRIGLRLSSPVLRTLTEGILRHAGHVLVELGGNGTKSPLCDVVVTDATNAQGIFESLPVIALTSSTEVKIPGAAAVLEKSAVASRLAGLVERFRPVDA